MDVETRAASDGLTLAEVEERRRAGLVNVVPESPSRTFGQIVRANVFTPVNAIIGTLFVLIMIAAPGPDALFVGVVVANSSIGIAQEVRAKRTLDELILLAAPRARVVRGGETSEVGVGDVVQDDVLELASGDQAVVDGEVLVEAGLDLDESLLTGESDPVSKLPGDEVMSGSFVTAGSGRYRATSIGAESYANRLAEEARRFTLVQSELRTGINRILRWLTWVIPPVAVLLLWNLLSVEEWREALRGTVAASVAMVPDGLVLLTSIAFITGVLALARRKALTKELASVELLARVDVICLDKTGTITTGNISYAGFEALDVDVVSDGEPVDVDDALAAIAASDPSPNPTLAAICGAHPDPPPWEVTDFTPFSSDRKWAATTFAEAGTWVLGAPEMLITSADEKTGRRVSAQAEDGRRVLLLARADRPPVDGRLTGGVRPVGLVLLEDEVRPDAREIFGFFEAQGVTLRVISGDHPVTVASVARRAGIRGAERWMDARDLPEAGEELAEVLETTTVFGRVTPHQKRDMVHALQSRDHVVAMTGDGVNDVLALKDSDMGISMGSGSAATRSVAQLVLLDNRFSTLPRVLAEGRRVINNIERVANLFVVKTTYAVLLALAVSALRVPYPFFPRHLTLVGTFSIGVPGFFLAMAPNARRAVPGFVDRVLRFSIPAGFVAATATFVVYEALRRDSGVSLAEARTGATVTLLAVGLVVLTKLARPIVPWKAGLVCAMGASYLVVLNVRTLAEFFALEMPPTDTWWMFAVAIGLATLALVVGPRLIPWWGVGDAAQAGDPRVEE